MTTAAAIAAIFDAYMNGEIDALPVGDDLAAAIAEMTA